MTLDPPDVWIEWVKCHEHYTPEDDALILKAATNYRLHQKILKESK